jgi:transaldolase/glucose-6-phosphate isomerase
MVDAAAQHERWKELTPRLRSGDPAIWGPPGTPELANRLGWLDLPETMQAEIAGFEALAAAAVADSTDRVVLLGMGGSSLAPEVFASILGVGAGHPPLTVLDSTHPDQVRRVRESINPARTLFVVSSKSGTTLETLSGFRYFWRETGGAGDRFIAITDPGTPLQVLAGERGFRAVVKAPADVGGRFSALTSFGLVPAALVGADLNRLLSGAAETDWDEAISMGVTWATEALNGRDKLTFLTSPGLRSFPIWIEQLIAESLGKNGKGIVPIAGEPALDRYGDDRVFQEVRLAAEPVMAAPAGHPHVAREVSDPYGLGGEMLAAEIGTAVAGEILGVHPFDQPDVELAKQRARQALDAEPVRVDLFDFFSPVLADRIDDLLASMKPGDYFGIHAYLPSDDVTDALIARIRHRVGNRAGAATTAGYGPRFLHSTGQLHKGGPNNGVFLQLIDEPHEDLAVPEGSTTFGRIIAAQALGDYLALQERGRRVIRVDLGGDRESGLTALLAAIG